MINYNNLLDNREAFLRYAFKTCNSFALLFNTKTSYSDGYIDAKENVHIDLKPYLIEQHKPGISTVCGQSNYIPKKRVLNLYKCCKATKEIILSMNDVFDCEASFNNGHPEDISFFRNNKPWFSSVYHEEYAGFFGQGQLLCDTVTLQDIEFFDSLNLLTVSSRRCKEIIKSRI